MSIVRRISDVSGILLVDTSRAALYENPRTGRTPSVASLQDVSHVTHTPAGAVIMKRQQDMPAEAFVPCDEAVAMLERGDRSILALSYGWLTALHPDPRGTTLAAVRRFLEPRCRRSGQRYRALLGLLQPSAKGPKRRGEDRGGEGHVRARPQSDGELLRQRHGHLRHPAQHRPPARRDHRVRTGRVQPNPVRGRGRARVVHLRAGDRNDGAGAPDGGGGAGGGGGQGAARALPPRASEPRQGV